MAVRRKILIVVGNLSHLDQFVIHGFFKELSESSSVLLAMPAQDMSSQRWAELSPHIQSFFAQIVGYEYGDSARKAGSQIGEASTFRFRKNATGYRTRLRNKFLIGLGVPISWKTGAGLKEIWRNRAEARRRTIKEMPSVIRGTKICFWLWSRIAASRILKNCQLPRIIRDLNPDAVLILMQRQAGSVVAAIDGAAKLGVPSLLLPVKWDNASSKSPLLKTPSRMLVYNKQVGTVCSRLHRMELNSIVAVGSVEIGKGKSSDLGSGVRSLVLIGSTADSSSSEPWLQSVSRVLSNYKSQSFSDMKTIWRPYPTADASSLAFMNSFLQTQREIELDPDIQAGVSHRATRIDFAGVSSAYARFCSLLESAVVVISECTSVIVDSRARGLPVIVPAFKKDAVIGSQWYLLNGFEHLQGLRTTSGVFIAEDEQELERLLIDFLTNPRRIAPDNSGENIFVDERSYAQRVLDVVDEVVAEKSAWAV
ncbi:MAG: hypothetical protein O2841_04625 [Actinomycetota bacterium]|nr:hypothetical protein [Actinomycetota bacterium]